MSPPEVKLWVALRSRPLGVKFRRQHPLGPYVLDFICADARLCVEVDGALVHAGIAAALRDAERDHWLAARGILVHRVPAADVHHDPAAVADGLARLALTRARNRAAPSTAAGGPPPRAGEDQNSPPRHGEGDDGAAMVEGPDRLSAAFTRAKAQSRAALVTFVTGGDPDLGQTPEIVRACVAGGADIVEIGMPFSDPMADGPAIQNASLRALGAGTTVTGILDAVRAVRATDPTTPLILMGYLNPLLAYGTERFAGDAHAAGVDGCIVVDAPPEEDAAIGPQLRAHGLHLIRLATPTTDAARLPAVLSGASGFLYYVAVAGITGTASADPETIRAALAPIRAASDIPLAVGFGVRTPAQARAIAGAGADAVVVGSALVEIIGHAAQTRANDIPARVETFVRALREGLSAPKSSA